MTLELDVNTWAAEQFGSCDLGDVRRTARAVTMAAQFAANPSGSTPEQTETWADCKAAYRLFDCRDVTFSGLASPHWQRTKARTSGHYLLLGDTTVVTFDGDRNISGMGIVTDGSAKGYLLHSSLMVSADSSHQVLGLAGQTIYYRQRVSKSEKQRQRLQRPRESEIWGEVIDQVGPPPENVRWTHVFDRGGDNFEVYCHLLLDHSDWVVRAAQLTRLIVTPAGENVQLGDYLLSCPVAGTYELEVKANNQQPARTALVEVRFGQVGLPMPHDCGRFTRECGITFITMHAVEVREVNPPPGVEPLRWVLLTSHAAATFEEALAVITYYEQRPLIEEFHKALKTGCRLEDRLYETAQRWEAVTAMLSIVAVRLLQLKTVAKAEPNRPAEELVPRKWIAMLSAVRKGKSKRIHTAYEFMRALAGLGGHLGRKRDGEPGWITLWRGFNKLHLLLRGAAAAYKRCG
jgi:Transposase DNA-binding/Transposase Tn5 dimerisation domain